MNEAPCLHYVEAPSRCLAGRNAPRDCAESCGAYAADMVSALSLDPEDRTRCEIWTRVMGYHRPVSAFNDGKQAEHAERRYFVESQG